MGCKSRHRNINVVKSFLCYYRHSNIVRSLLCCYGNINDVKSLFCSYRNINVVKSLLCISAISFILSCRRLEQTDALDRSRFLLQFIYYRSSRKLNNAIFIVNSSYCHIICSYFDYCLCVCISISFIANSQYYFFQYESIPSQYQSFFHEIIVCMNPSGPCLDIMFSYLDRYK